MLRCSFRPYPSRPHPKRQALFPHHAPPCTCRIVKFSPAAPTAGFTRAATASQAFVSTRGTRRPKRRGASSLKSYRRVRPPAARFAHIPSAVQAPGRTCCGWSFPTAWLQCRSPGFPAISRSDSRMHPQGPGTNPAHETRGSSVPRQHLWGLAPRPRRPLRSQAGSSSLGDRCLALRCRAPLQSLP